MQGVTGRAEGSRLDELKQECVQNKRQKDKHMGAVRNDAARAQGASERVVLNGGWQFFYSNRYPLTHYGIVFFNASMQADGEVDQRQRQPGRADKRELLAAFMARLIIMYDSDFLSQTHHVDLFFLSYTLSSRESYIIPAYTTF